MEMMARARTLLLTAVFTALAASAQSDPVLPDGLGRAELEKMCKGCHELARSVSLRQDRAGWLNTLTKMNAFGMKSNEQEFNLVLDYLARHYPPDELPPINVNKAKAIELESYLGLRRSQAAAVIAWRKEQGDFKSIDDLKKVPNIDAETIESKRHRIIFE
ncbi:MAG: ComEA family DNA-binding protein [Bryobacteraceae bacterium]